MGFSDAFHRETVALLVNTLASSTIATIQTKEEASWKALTIISAASSVDFVAGLSIHRLARRGLSENREEMISNNSRVLLLLATMIATNAACFAAFRFINDEPVNDPTTAAAWLLAPAILTIMICNDRVVRDTATQCGAQTCCPDTLNRFFPAHEYPNGEVSQLALLEIGESDHRHGREFPPRQGGVDDDPICRACCPRRTTNQ